MSELSPEVAAKASNLEGHVLRLIAAQSQQVTADRVGVDNSTLSRWLSDGTGMRRACLVLAALGVRFVDDREPTFSAAYVESLETLARHALDQRKSGNCDNTCGKRR